MRRSSRGIAASRSRYGDRRTWTRFPTSCGTPTAPPRGTRASGTLHRPGAYPPALLTRVNLGVYDILLRFGGTDPPDGRVVIVDVDDRSLSTIGQWPWRRDVVAELIERLRSMGARTIALDMIFPSPIAEMAQRVPRCWSVSRTAPAEPCQRLLTPRWRRHCGADAWSWDTRSPLGKPPPARDAAFFTRWLSPSFSPPGRPGTLLSSAPPMRFAVCRLLRRPPARPDSSTPLPTATAS